MQRNILPKSALSLLIAGVAAALAGCVTPGVTAAVHRDAPRMQRILDQPNHGNEDLDNLLSNSIAFDCLDCARLLLKAGAKADANHLSAAVLADHETIARLLVDSGAGPSAAMTLIHTQTRTWIGGSGIPAEQAQRAAAFFKKLARERDAASDAPAASDAAAPSAPAAAPKPPSSRLAPSFHEDKRADDFALVVGVENYDALPPAAYAERDAEAAAEFMKALGVPAGNVVTLTGARATRSGLAKNLEGWLAENVDENSTVYFYYAGRGAADPKSGRAYLVPFDGDPRYLEQTAYPLKRAYEKLGGLKAKRVIVMLDVSFSSAGGADDGFNSANGKIALLAAGDGDQISGTSAESGYGLFTARLLEGLNGSAKDAAGQVTLKSLFDDLKPRVADDARRAGRSQVPQFESGGSATDRVVLRTK